MGFAIRKKFEEFEENEVFVTPANGGEKVNSMVKRYLGMKVDNEANWV